MIDSMKHILIMPKLFIVSLMFILGIFINQAHVWQSDNRNGTFKNSGHDADYAGLDTVSGNERLLHGIHDVRGFARLHCVALEGHGKLANRLAKHDDKIVEGQWQVTLPLSNNVDSK